MMDRRVVDAVPGDVLGREELVVQGSSEADGPHIGSSGGNIGIVTIRPTKETGAFVKQVVGGNGTMKTFARLNTGEVNGLSNWLSASHTEGQMWRGSGAVRADKVEWNSFFDAGNGNTANLILKYHEQDNNSYSQLTKSQFQQYGRKYDPYPATPAVGANGTVTLPQAPGSSAAVLGSLYVPPAQKTVNFNRILPNLGFTFSPFGPMHQFYADYAAGLAAPRTDNLYNGGNNGNCVTATGASSPTAPGCVYSSFSTVNPETSANYDIGYRFVSDMVTASITAYNTQFKNRIVTSFDQDQGISIDRNIGSVNVDGVDAEANVALTSDLSVYTSTSYTHSRVSAGPQAIILVGAGGAPINLAGKTLVETPDWTISQRYEYKLGGLTLGFGGKYVGSRFATDNNDYKVPSYFTADADISYDLGRIGWDGSYLKVNGYNLFNEKYLGSISSKPCFIPTLASTSSCGSLPTFVVGSPQTFQVTLRSVF